MNQHPALIIDDEKDICFLLVKVLIEKKILVVDDDVDICTLLSRFLGKNGFEVEQAYSGKAAMALLNAGRFDLVLSDFRLGDMEGTEILTAIKKISSTIPVIIITGYS